MKQHIGKCWKSGGKLIKMKGTEVIDKREINMIVSALHISPKFTLSLTQRGGHALTLKSS